MKRIVTVLFLTVLLQMTYAQTGNVGVNTTSPEATLEIKADPSKVSANEPSGVLIPRLTGDEVKAMTGMETSTLIYANTAATTPDGTAVNITKPGYYYYDGTVWVALGFDASKVLQPWYKVGTNEPATENTDSIYTKGAVVIGRNTPIATRLTVADFSTDADTSVMIVDGASTEHFTTTIKNGSGAAKGLHIIAGGQNSEAQALRVDPAGAAYDPDKPSFVVSSHNGGEVGIGVNDPTQKLDIDGTARLRDMPESTSDTDSLVMVSPTGVLKKRSFPTGALEPNEWVYDADPASKRIELVRTNQPEYATRHYVASKGGYKQISSKMDSIFGVPADSISYNFRGVYSSDMPLYVEKKYMDLGYYEISDDDEAPYHQAFGTYSVIPSSNTKNYSNHYGYRLNLYNNGSGNVDYSLGLFSNVSVGENRGIRKFVAGTVDLLYINNSAPVASVEGTRNIIQIADNRSKSNSVNVNQAIGTYNRLSCSADAGIIKDLKGTYVYPSLVSGGSGVTVNTLKGFEYDIKSKSGASPFKGYTVMKQYGVYLSDVVGAQENYAIYTKKGYNSLGDTLQIRNINTTVSTATDNDKIVVADGDGVLKTKEVSALAQALAPALDPIAQSAAQSVEPWYKAGTNEGATSNTDSIYTSGAVAIGQNMPSATRLTVVDNSIDPDTSAMTVLGNSMDQFAMTIKNGRGGAKGLHIIAGGNNPESQAFRVDPTGANFDPNRPSLLVSGDDGGQVGIGLIDPQTRLHVSGNARFSRREGLNQYIEFTHDSGANRMIFAVRNNDRKSNIFDVKQSTTGLPDNGVDDIGYKFKVLGVTKMAIKETGDVEATGSVKVGDHLGSTPTPGTIRYVEGPVTIDGTDYPNGAFQGYTASGWVVLHSPN